MSSKSLAKAAPSPLTVSRPELLVGGSDRAFRRLIHDIVALAMRHEAVRDGLAVRIGLTGVEFSTLVALRHEQAEGDVGIKELADYLHVSGSFVTTVIGKLVQRGLVAKRADVEDKRRVRLTVTKKGHDLLAAVAPVQRQVNDMQFGSLSNADFQALLRVLPKLIESSDKALTLQKLLAAD
jgi:MarR family transcriptional regulator, organic hydroperoxide resistance regulator